MSSSNNQIFEQGWDEEELVFDKNDKENPNITVDKDEFPMTVDELGIELTEPLQHIGNSGDSCYFHQMMTAVNKFYEKEWKNEVARKAQLRLLSMWFYSLFYGHTDNKCKYAQ